MLVRGMLGVGFLRDTNAGGGMLNGESCINMEAGKRHVMGQHARGPHA
jgi:hypothetical protein